MLDITPEVEAPASGILVSGIIPRRRPPTLHSFAT